MESIADRAIVAGQLPPGTVLSPQSLISCSPEESYSSDTNMGCNGGWPFVAMNYLDTAFTIGTPGSLTTCTTQCSDGCDPYLSGSCGEDDDSFNNGCGESVCGSKVCASSNSTWQVSFSPVTAFPIGYDGFVNAMPPLSRLIAVEIATNGPISTCFELYANFYTFFQEQPNGTYTTLQGPLSGGHCVLIVGWGTDPSTSSDYWIVQNSCVNICDSNHCIVKYFDMYIHKHNCANTL